MLILYLSGLLMIHQYLYLHTKKHKLLSALDTSVCCASVSARSCSWINHGSEVLKVPMSPFPYFSIQKATSKKELLQKIFSIWTKHKFFMIFLIILLFGTSFPLIEKVRAHRWRHMTSFRNACCHSSCVYYKRKATERSYKGCFHRIVANFIMSSIGSASESKSDRYSSRNEEY